MIPGCKNALRNGVARNLVILFLMFGIIPLGVLIMISFSFYFQGQKKGISNIQKEIAERVSLGISANLEKTMGEVQLFAEILDPESHSIRTIRASAYHLLDQKSKYDLIAVAGPDGNEICKVSRYYTFRPDELGNISHQDSFKIALEGTTHLSPVHVSGLSGLPRLEITAPILDQRGKITGILQVGFSVAKMWDLISRYRIGNDRYAYVVDSRGVLIAYQEMSSILAQRQLKDIQGVRNFMEGHVGVYEYNGLNNEPVVGANAIIPLTGWGVVVEEPLKKALRDLYVLFGIAMGIFGMTAILAVYLGIRFSFKTIVNPIKRLQEQAAIIAKGNFNRRVPVSKSDELGQLSEAFNMMVSDLQNTTVSRDLLIQEIETRKLAEEALEKERDQAQQYLDIAGVLLVALDNDGRITLINRKGCELLEYGESELIDVNWFDVCLQEPSRSHIRRVHKRLIAGDVELIEHYESPVLTKSGRERIVSFRNAAIRSKDSSIVGILSSGEDITERKRLEKTLSDSAELLKAILESTADGILAVNESGAVVGANTRFREMWRIPEALMAQGNDARLLGYVLDQLEQPEVFLARVQSLYASLERDFDTLVFKDGRIFERFSHPLIQDGEVSGRVWSFRDVTIQKKAEEALRENEEKYRMLFESMSQGVSYERADGVPIDVNSAALKMFGLTRGEYLHRTPDSPAWNIIYEDGLQVAAAERPSIKALKTGKPVTDEVLGFFNPQTSSYVWVVVNAIPQYHPGVSYPHGVIVTLHEITERKLAEEALRAALQDKEVLLREIHHRVKNNMQVISSLLTIQAERVENEQLRQALFESQQRIVAMAMIHEVLYSGQNLAAIDLSAYLKSLVYHLQGVYSSRADVKIALELDEIELGIDQAVPCGLIMNELVTNSFKHAFPEGSQGTIQIKIHPVDEGEVVLEVRDNGVGLAPDLDLSNPSSLGLRLVQGLLKHQLKGRLEVSTEGGTALTLRWPLPARKGGSA